jgi:hypothetical protein
MSVHRIRQRFGSETGSAIILVAVLMALMTFGLIGYQIMSYSYQNMIQHLNSTGQADQAAKAGLIEAISWFRRQSPQPVANLTNPDSAFRPTEAAGDTIDQTIGLVKQYPISSGSVLWARYEVKYGSVTPKGFIGVHDITDLRTQNHGVGEGYVWSVQSNGYIFRQLDALLPFNRAPNTVMATSRVVAEVRRLTLTLPTDAALTVNNRSTVSLANSSQLIGGSAGLAYYTGATGPTTSGTGWSYTPITVPTAGMTPEAIFTAPMDQIRGMADVMVSSQSMPSSFPSEGITFIDGSVTFDGTHPLHGAGLLFINGNLTLTSTANTVFSGLIYVNGNCSIAGSTFISGAMVVTGSFTADSGADTLTVRYDSTVINTLASQIGMYHLSHSLRYLFAAGSTR